MSDLFSLTKNEYELMNVLWDSDIPMAKRDISEKCVENQWSDTYLKKMLSGLLKKNAIRPVGSIKVGNVASRLYEPTLSRDDYNLSRHKVRSVKALTSLVGKFYKEANEDDRHTLVSELEELLVELKGSEK